jgi:hypothetical protein
MIDFDPTIANDALHLAMEWGKDWMMPTQERLAARHTGLHTSDLDRYNAMARDAMLYGHVLVYEQAEALGFDNQELAEKCQKLLLHKYAWISEENLQRLFSQGMYYAWKDGVGR